MNALYSDRLIEITSEEIILKSYRFPFGSKHVRWEDILHVHAEKPTLQNGSWRTWGSGDCGLRSWFPLDIHRSSRDKIFVVELKNSPRRIGFTAEDSATVEAILRSNSILI